MQTDFRDANDRHTEDAERLFEGGRYANADHLYGIAAECGLKCLMVAFGMPMDPVKDKPSRKPDTSHVNALWDRFESYRYGHHRGAGYVLPVVNPFDDWQASQRYAHQDQFDVVRVEPHRQSAMSIREMLKKAQAEGLI